MKTNEKKDGRRKIDESANSTGRRIKCRKVGGWEGKKERKEKKEKTHKKNESERKRVGKEQSKMY